MARVLIVDDQEDLAELVAHFVRSLGDEPVVLTDSRQVADAVRQHKPDVVILDYQMPEVSGTAALGLIRATLEGKTVPVIFLSGMPGYRMKVTVLESKTERFLAKPIDRERLKQVLDDALGRGGTATV